MIDQSQLDSLRGSDVYDSKGDKIGTAGQVWTGGDDPYWVSVKTGLFGLNESLVPLHGARVEGDRVVVNYDKDTVKDAPNISTDADEPLSTDEVARLYDYYHLSPGGQRTGDTDTDYRQSASYDTDTDAATGSRHRRTGDDDAMTLSEERLNVGTQREQVATARLRKYITTENVQQTVPVQREQVRLEREPITDANRDQAMSGPDFTEAEHEVTLTEEQPVVTTEAVPVERVRLGKDQVQAEETVNVDVRKEQIDTETDAGRRPGDDDR
jgi:uncharacterized protein (TIGR02271 family)